MIAIDNKTDIKINLDILEDIALSITDRDIELLLVDDAHIKELNLHYRHNDKPTDVLSFPLYHQMKNMPLGSIVISLETAQKQSKEHNHDLKNEVAILFIHGMLHLLGFDHEADEGEMESKEEGLARQFNLSLSLTKRADLR
ncbi:MAG: rRNA maturation RNase YbeY [Campylobacterales bacterium]|nr:rRNA maturation RNase YbeY [Campylobacterales bacterium]